MSGRSSTGSATKSRSILDYFKPKSALNSQKKPVAAKGTHTVTAGGSVIDVSSGEDDTGEDGLLVLTEIKCNSKTSSARSGGKIIRKSAPARIGARPSFPPVHQSEDLSAVSSDITVCSENQPQPQHQSRDSGSFVSDEGDGDSICNAEERMELDMSEFLDVLVDEAMGSEQEDKLQQVISSSVASDEAVTSSENDYKLTNFRNMIDFVLNDASHSHLLNSQDWGIIETVTSLSVSAQRLLVRLLLRKHNWIRSSHINYPEVADPESMQQLLRDLVQHKLLIHCSTIDSLEEALSLLEVKELKSCAASLGTRGAGASANLMQNRQTLIDSIIKHAKSNQSIKSHFSSSRTFSVAEVALNQVKKILGDTAYHVAHDVSCLFSRLTYLYYPPQVNEDENGVAISHEFFNQLKVTQGIMKYPDYQICKKEIIFRTRDDLVRYESACRLETLVLAAILKKDHEIIVSKYFPEAENAFNRIFTSGAYRLDQSLPIFLRNQTAGHVYTRCLSHMVQSFEQSKQHERAVNVLRNLIDQDTYCLTYKGKWYERLVIDLEKHMKQPHEALSALTRSMHDSAVTLSFKYNLYVRGKKAAKSGKKLKFPTIEEFDLEKCKEKVIESATLSKPIQGRKSIFIATGSTSDESVCLPVEQVALNHYQQEEGFTRGSHSESLMYHALFNILLWNQIYAPEIDDAFRTHHQSLPLDFVHEDFYRRRKEILDKRMDQIRRMTDAQVGVEIDRIWTENYGTQCLIRWPELQLQDLKELAFCMGVDVLVAIFERLFSNFRFNRSGFPDLILWNADEKRVKAVEVKGPGDSLSGKQILWLDYFKSCGLPSEVCYVRAARNSDALQ